MSTPDRLDRSDSQAILIGAASYADTRFPAIPTATTSLRAMYRMLIDTHLGGWGCDQVTTIHDPTDCRHLAQCIRRVAKNTTGPLLLYFVGHGTLNRDGELILALTDTDFDDPDLTGLEFTRIRAALLDSPARVKIVVLDCCYSGREINVLGPNVADLANHTEVKGAYTLTAADRAADAGQSDGCTAFTGQFLELIRTGLPDGPPVLTFADLYPHLRRRLAAGNLPTPNQRGTDTAEHYPVAHNCAVRPSAVADLLPLRQPTQHWPGSTPSATAQTRTTTSGQQTPPQIVAAPQRPLPETWANSQQRTVNPVSGAALYPQVAPMGLPQTSSFQLTPKQRVSSARYATFCILMSSFVMALGFIEFNVVFFFLGVVVNVASITLLVTHLRSKLILTQDGVHFRDWKTIFIQWREIDKISVRHMLGNRTVRFELRSGSKTSWVPIDGLELPDDHFDDKVDIIRQMHAQFGTPQPKLPGPWWPRRWS